MNVRFAPITDILGAHLASKAAGPLPGISSEHLNVRIDVAIEAYNLRPEIQS